MSALLLTVTSTGPCQRCAWCHDASGELPGALCAACGTWLHEGCLGEAAGCPSLGCPLRPRRARLTITLDPAPSRGFITSARLCALFGALACAAAGLGIPAFNQLFAEVGVQPSGCAAVLVSGPAWGWWILGAVWLLAWPLKDRWVTPHRARSLDAAAALLILLGGSGAFLSLSLSSVEIHQRL